VKRRVARRVRIEGEGVRDMAAFDDVDVRWEIAILLAGCAKLLSSLFEAKDERAVGGGGCDSSSLGDGCHYTVCAQVILPAAGSRRSRVGETSVCKMV
jgi:hypothetical protein